MQKSQKCLFWQLDRCDIAFFKRQRNEWLTLSLILLPTSFGLVKFQTPQGEALIMFAVHVVQWMLIGPWVFLCWHSACQDFFMWQAFQADRADIIHSCSLCGDVFILGVTALRCGARWVIVTPLIMFLCIKVVAFRLPASFGATSGIPMLIMWSLMSKNFDTSICILTIHVWFWDLLSDTCSGKLDQKDYQRIKIPR